MVTKIVELERGEDCRFVKIDGIDYAIITHAERPPVMLDLATGERHPLVEQQKEPHGQKL